MSEIIFESRTQISENGNVILYEKRYHGVLTENGSVSRGICSWLSGMQTIFPSWAWYT